MVTSRRPALAAAALLAAVSLPSLLTGCTTDSGTGRSSTDAADAEAVVRDFYEEFGKGDFEAACALWAPDYARLSVDRWNDEDYGKPVDDCPGLLEALTGIYAMVGDPADQLKVTEARGEITDDGTARVDVTIASSQGDAETYLLTKTDGDWLITGDDPGPDMLESTPPPSSP